jgi:uncharacterized protein (TIGR00730 family)
MEKSLHIAVYCASSNAVDPLYFEAARELGTLMAQRGSTLVYGGGRVGLMGAVSAAVFQNGGKVVGVIPHFLERLEIGNHDIGELIYTDGMRERKAIMEDRADAFITLPGGFGTLEEIFEILTGRQLGVHHKPIVLLNTRGYYNPLLAMLQSAVDQYFVKPGHFALLHVADTPQQALDYIYNFSPQAPEEKFTEEELRKSVPEQAKTGEVAGEE